jgi:two-component system response regulator GlrR
MAEDDDNLGDKPLVLVVEDDTDHLILVQRWLIKAGYLVDGASQGRQALARIASQRPDMVITDLVMDEMDGLQLLEQIHLQDPLLPVLMVSGEAGIPEALSAASHGVVGFLEKPVDEQTLLQAVADTLEHLSTPGTSAGDALEQCVIHRSQAMETLLQRVRQLRDDIQPVLILGPEGSGRQHLARCMHNAGNRGEGPFISISCTQPARLLEAELFGYTRGEFVGATDDYPGLIRQAQGGTLLLGAIEELPLPLQGRLVQLLEENEDPLAGGSDIRLVTTSDAPLEEMVAQGGFDEALFYRLGVPLVIPPLNERHEDIPALVTHFLQELSGDGQPARRFAPDALKQLVMAPWPGNARQLKRVVEHCYLLTPGEIIPASVVNEALAGQTQAPPTLDEARLAFERRYLTGVLRATNGNVTNAARLAGRNRTEFYKLLHRHELDPGAFRP